MTATIDLNADLGEGDSQDVELLGVVPLRLIRSAGQLLLFRVIRDGVIPRHPRIPLLQPANGLSDLGGLDQPAPANPLFQLGDVGQETPFLLLANRTILLLSGCVKSCQLSAVSGQPKTWATAMGCTRMGHHAFRERTLASTSRLPSWLIADGG